MDPSERLRRSVLIATVLLAAGTVAVASVPPRPLRSIAAIAHALSLPVATYWLAVVALLAVADRLASPARTVDRRTVGQLAAVVFTGGLAIELSPLARLVATPTAAGPIAEPVALGVRNALFPTGLFAATALGALRLRGSRPLAPGVPLSPGENPLSAIASEAASTLARPLAAAAALAAGIELALRFLATGAPYPALVVVEAVVRSLAGLVEHAVLAVALLALFAAGARLRSLAVGAALAWVALFLGALATAVLGAVAGVVIVSLTTTPIAAVDASALGEWPSPDAWPLLLRTGTYLALGLGVLAVQNAPAPAEDAPTGTAGETGEAGDASGQR